MKILFSLIALMGLIYLQSCSEVLPDRVVVSVVDSTYINASNPSAQNKVVLFEEYTGASCVNCPDGHAILKEIKNLYKGRIATIGLHQSSLAEPVHGSTINFITKVAEELASRFGVNSLPSAMIDRKEFDGVKVLGRFTWKAKYESIFNTPVKLNVESRVFVESKTNRRYLEVKITCLEDIAESLNYSVMLGENKIVAPQKNGSDVIEDYEHEYVFRKMYTNTLGAAIVKVAEDVSGYKKGRVFVRTIDITEQEASWKLENLFTISFVTNAVTNEVLQASEVKFQN